MPNTVLVLEDSKTQARIVSALFEKAGFKTDIVHDRFDAWHKLKTRRYFLILLDVFIGEDNTLDYINDYRALADTTPIAIMTAGQRERPLAASRALNEARRAEVEFLLPKPFDLNDVKQVCAETERIRRRKGPIQRVLVIDDDAHARIIYRNFLEEEGFYVAESASIEDALIRLEITRVDAIVSDIIMPGIGGMTGIKIISATWPDVPIIAITGYTKNTHHLEDALERGARYSLAKPFNKSQLMQLILKSLPSDGNTVMI
ncbi:response regulator [Asticcacaulis sp. BYS171W]|uniref:Response regulator n=1 Tax=Asticcacaulis aquaticus TaxID=2984212 RepID=A0ABT5HTY2_9CAUL|nr:response regulator [Asticcacaulis aquaticus]MDC7683530.1 response regulator [Asticcacaulis aquaticus]